ncbi:MAG TPA: 4Fe-4S binding protein [Spirochaetota bacterium]|nr:4Fe-4S binding protein [Spirochaetota bacterium]
MNNNRKGYSLPTTVFLSLLMLMNTGFFLMARNQGLRLVSGAIIAGVLVGIFAAMMYTGNIARYRRIFFAMAAFLFFPSFIATLIEHRGSMAICADTALKNENPMCHITFTSTAIPYLLKGVLVFPAKVSHYYAAFYAMLIMWIIATLSFGRGWCSWICFYGGWDDTFSRLAKKERITIDPKNDKVRYFSFAILIFVALASLVTMSVVYCEWLCPFRTITEFSPVTDFTSMIMFIIMTFTFFGLLIIVPFLTRKRFQCMSFCPFGAMQSLIGKIGFYKVRIDTDKCTRCMKCVKVCPTMSISEDCINEKRGKPLMTCTMCGECITECPAKAIDYTFMGKRRCGTGFFNGLHSRFSARQGIVNTILAAVFKSFDEVLSPRALFIFAAFTFGMIVSSGFSVSTVERLMNLFINGTFFVK